MHQLPLELIVKIIQYLDLFDIVNLRITCKDLYYLLESEYLYFKWRYEAKLKWRKFTISLFNDTNNPLILLFDKNKKIYRKLVKEYCLLAVTCQYAFFILNGKSFLLSMDGKNPNYILTDKYTINGHFMKHHFYLCT